MDNLHVHVHTITLRLILLLADKLTQCRSLLRKFSNQHQQTSQGRAMNTTDKIQGTMQIFSKSDCVEEEDCSRRSPATRSNHK
eukprot:6229226-Amphidinium_carterae.1